MSSPNQPKPATRSSKRNKRPSSPVLEFLSNARKKRGGGSKESSKESGKHPKPPPVVTTVTGPLLSAQVTTPTSAVNAANTTGPEVTLPVALSTSGTTPAAAPSISTRPSDSANNIAEHKKELGVKPFVFKCSHFEHQGRIHSAKKVKSWKSLKQILATQRNSLDPDHVTYATIDAPPSFKPAKKYSDLSGFEARYTDPQTKLRYSNTQEFAQVRILSSETVAGLLSLRRANQEVS